MTLDNQQLSELFWETMPTEMFDDLVAVLAKSLIGEADQSLTVADLLDQIPPAQRAKTAKAIHAAEDEAAESEE